MAIFRKGKNILEKLHEGKAIKQIYHIGKKYLSEYLSPAAIADITAAFGAEAAQVISRTKKYLSAIARTDTTRAQQLALFINEDPLLVCSLVETSKTRWLVGDGNAYIITELTASADSEYETKVIPSTKQNATYFALFGCGYEHTTYIGSNQVNHNGKYGDVFNECKNAVEITIKLGSYGFILNDGEPRVLSNSYNAQIGGRNMWIFHANIGNGAIWTGFMAYYKQTKGGSQYADLIPYNNGTECGMLDLVTYTFYPNANTSGQFTIQLTDKT